MTKSKLIEVLKKYHKGEIYIHEVLTAVEAYSSASNNGNALVSGSLPSADVRKKAEKIGKEFKKKWEAKYVGFGDGSTIELWWRHQIEDAFGGNDR